MSEKLCPSGRCQDGAMLLGIVGPSGVVGYVGPVRIDQEFIDTARQGRPPEKRFRFAEPCQESQCAQWSGSRCNVIDWAVANPSLQDADAGAGALPKCGIRSVCRWFAQVGAQACAVCPLVVTNIEGGSPAGACATQG